MHEVAELYVKPTYETSGEKISIMQGDIFKIEDYNTDFVAVSLFSGETRYLKHKSLEFMYNQYAEIDFPVVNPEMCKNIEVARKNTEDKTYLAWPDDLEKRIHKDQYLFDQNVIKIFRDEGISAIYPSALMQCVNDNIVPPIIEF